MLFGLERLDAVEQRRGTSRMAPGAGGISQVRGAISRDLGEPTRAGDLEGELRIGAALAGEAVEVLERGCRRGSGAP